MKNVLSNIIKFLKKNKLISVAVLFITVGIALSFSNAFGELTPIKSIEIFSENLDYSSKEPGAWKITKSAKWSAKGTAEITFDVDTIVKKNKGNVDVLFVLDISDSMTGNKLDRVKADSVELIESLLSNDKNKVGLITFGTTSVVVSELTNDKNYLINSIQNLITNGNTNYYRSLLNIDSILRNYTKENEKDVIVLFLTDGYPNENIPNEVGFYKYLKRTYPFVTFNAVQYEMGKSILEPITKVSDNQYLADMETLKNVLFNASIVPITYDNFEINDFIDTRYFYVDSDKDINADIGNIIFDKTSQKVTWKIDRLKSGFKAKLTIKARLKTELIGSGGVYPTNEHEEIRSKIEEVEEDINSKETPVLADNYKVKYDANAPDGCRVDGVLNEEAHSVYDTVGISDTKLVCEGYQFKGWDIVTSEVSKINDDYFIMPEKDVLLKGKWSKLSLTKSMEGTVSETLTLYRQVRNDVKDSTKFARKYVGDTSTFKGDSDIYYYYGSAQNNNVLFANYCWKIIRTTDTGGVKLLYNGVPDANGVCKNTLESASLTKEQMNTNSYSVAFNEKHTSPADVGYMYNVRYETSRKNFYLQSKYVLDTLSSPSIYKYADTYVFENDKYKIENAYDCPDDYTSLVGKYASLSESPSYLIYYVVKVEGNNVYCIMLSGGNDLASSNIVFGESVAINDDGTYTLINSSSVKMSDWVNNYEAYKSFYTCGNNQVTCNSNTMKYVSSTTDIGYVYGKVTEIYKYGNNFIWDGTNYTLIDTVTSIGLPSNKSSHHYTCFNLTGVCNKLSYVYGEKVQSSTQSEIYYIVLEGGNSVQDVLNEMLYSDNVNTNNSTIKTAIDYWYEHNMTEYTEYLEDTVWCNDRSISDYGGWDSNEGDVFRRLTFRNAEDSNLTCKNERDRFTVSKENGNGKLIYPVGLIDGAEMYLANDKNSSPFSPLGISRIYLGMSPNNFYTASYNSAIDTSGRYVTDTVSNKRNVRPAVSLKPNIIFAFGDGSSNNPYVVDNDVLGYKISIQEGSNVKASADFIGEGRIIALNSNLADFGVSSFKMNGKLIIGDTFVMPKEDVFITDVVLAPCFESEHYPYPKKLDEEKEKTFEGAKSLTISLTYQTLNTFVDWIYLYDSTGKEYGKYGGSTLTNETITIPGNYIKLVFHTSSNTNEYYGYKAIITPNYS